MAESLTSVAHNSENSSGRSILSRVIADLITDRRFAQGEALLLQKEALRSDTSVHVFRRYESNDSSDVREGHTTRKNVFTDVGQESSKRYNGSSGKIPRIPWRQLATVEAVASEFRYNGGSGGIGLPCSPQRQLAAVKGSSR